MLYDVESYYIEGKHWYFSGQCLVGTIAIFYVLVFL